MRTRARRPAVVLLLLLTLAVFCQGCAPAGLPPASGDGLTVTFLDVGQGDAILARCGGQTLLADAGDRGTAQALVRTLSDLGVTSIDLLVGTHPHADHIGGLDDVIRAFDIGEVMLSDRTHNTRTYEDVLDAVADRGLTVTAPAPGESFPLGGARITVLGPVRSDYENLNDDSIVLKITFGSTAFLLMGDAEERAEADLLGGGADLTALVLKTGHHGSRSSSSADFLSAVSPRFAVISCGAGNSYGHPHAQTLEALADQGVAVYRTDLSGQITAVSDGTQVTFSVERPE